MSHSAQIAYWSLPVRDAERAQRFFGSVLRWTFSAPGSKGGVHVIESEPWGGLAPADRPFATLAFSVADIDAAVGRVRDLGGTATDPVDEGGHGPWSDCSSDTGMPFALFVRNPNLVEDASTTTSTTAAQLSYGVLQVPDLDRATAFFGPLLGWEFKPGSGGGVHVVGSEPGIGLAPGERSGWAGAFAPDDLEAAVARVRRVGGTATDPADVGGHGLWSDCTDDQGTTFALFVPDAAG
ncbi:MAG TPA: VOC family protein [Candidatus Nanopelagicales bacterium]|jgi:predicted enzyme related to lactoylglutathione lyase|nr:VOC family protein [Candidatus Nanopelagicales bacterium]